MNKIYQFVSKTVFCISALIVGPSYALSAVGNPPSATCFDFNSPIKSPLRDFSSPHASSIKDVSDSGKLPPSKGGIWGYAKGRVNYPIEAIYQQLLDHYTIKDPKRVKLKVYPQDRPGFRDFHVVMVTAITPVMDIHWEENWSYVVTEGTEEAPKKVVISYQKTDGTKYIPRLCGSIVLSAVEGNQTEVFLYEEVNALGKRSPKDTVQGHMGTLSTLRKTKSTASK